MLKLNQIPWEALNDYLMAVSKAETQLFLIDHNDSIPVEYKYSIEQLCNTHYAFQSWLQSHESYQQVRLSLEKKLTSYNKPISIRFLLDKMIAETLCFCASLDVDEQQSSADWKLVIQNLCDDYVTYFGTSEFKQSHHRNETEIIFLRQNELVIHIDIITAIAKMIYPHITLQDVQKIIQDLYE